MSATPTLTPDELMTITCQVTKEAWKNLDRYRRKRIEFEELFSEAYTAAAEALEKAGPHVRNVAAYVATAARNHLGKYLAKESRMETDQGKRERREPYQKVRARDLDTYRTRRRESRLYHPDQSDPEERPGIYNPAPLLDASIAAFSLPDPEAAAYRLRLDGLTFDAIGGRLGISAPAAKKRVDKAVSLLGGKIPSFTDFSV